MRLTFDGRQPASLLNHLVAAVFPARCAGCGHRGFWVCDECLAKTKWLTDPKCGRCGSPFGSPCRCHQLSPALSTARSAVQYDDWVRRAIHAFKYENEPARSAHLAELMIPLTREFSGIDALVPAPLHRTRLKQRGYNQSRLLANELEKATRLPVSDCLVRWRSTPRQVGLDAEGRRANVAGAFRVDDGDLVAGKRLLLIDDVMTTASTLSACAEALVLAGASWVGALTIARET